MDDVRHGLSPDHSQNRSGMHSHLHSTEHHIQEIMSIQKHVLLSMHSSCHDSEDASVEKRLYLLGLFFVWKTLEICICHSSRSVLSLLLFTLPIQPSSKTVRSVLKNGSILGTLDAESFCSHWPAEPFWTIRNRSQRVVYTQYEFSLDTSGCNMPTTNYLSVVTDIHTYIIDEFN